MSAVPKDMDALRAAQDAPECGDDWPEPQPLMATIEAEPYPLDALPPVLGGAIGEVQAFVQAPIPLVAASALAVVSAAVQAHVDVRRDEKLEGPSSLFLLTIADSGERKTACDSFFSAPLHEYERRERDAAAPLLKEFQAREESWTERHAAVRENIRQAAKNKRDTSGPDAALRDLMLEKPEAPRVPRLTYSDVTPEALTFNLAKRWPSGAILSSEAGVFFGAHGMSSDSMMRNMGAICQLWDGGKLSSERRTSESFVVEGARLTVGLAVQESTLRSFFEKSKGLARGTGFMARFLIAWPRSTQGTRMFRPAPPEWPGLTAFHQRIASILAAPVPIDDAGRLTPSLMKLQPDAFRAWERFYNEVEGQLGRGGELACINDVGAKAADNAARLAALLSVFERPDARAIDLASFTSAARIVAWHLNEARRFLGDTVVPQTVLDARDLEAWLIADRAKTGEAITTTTRVQQFATPVRLRQRATLEGAMAELVELGRLRVTQDGRRRLVELHPDVARGVTS